MHSTKSNIKLAANIISGLYCLVYIQATVEKLHSCSLNFSNIVPTTIACYLSSPCASGLICCSNLGSDIHAEINDIRGPK